MSKHAILVIKNYNNEYLQYYDKRWDSYLFLNCKMENNNNIIKEYISNTLNISKIKQKYITTKIHTKYSVSHKKYKKYTHLFYTIDIPITDTLTNGEFIINNIKFKWFSKEELNTDTRIQQVNNDIINYIYELKI